MLFLCNRLQYYLNKYVEYTTRACIYLHIHSQFWKFSSCKKKPFTVSAFWLWAEAAKPSKLCDLLPVRAKPRHACILIGTCSAQTWHLYCSHRHLSIKSDMCTALTLQVCDKWHLTWKKLNRFWSKKWTFLWFWTWKNGTLLGKVQLLPNHWLVPSITHTR